MSYIQDFEQELARKLESGTEDTASIVRFVSEKVLESYRNGITAGQKGATVKRQGESRRSGFVKKGRLVSRLPLSAKRYFYGIRTHRGGNRRFADPKKWRVSERARGHARYHERAARGRARFRLRSRIVAKRRQRRVWLSVEAGEVGYLREAYHGEPYATMHLCNEAFGTGKADISAAVLKERLAKALELVEERWSHRLGRTLPPPR